MKQIHKEKLQQALPTYCKQIGISNDEIPILVFDPKEYQRRAQHNHRIRDLGRADYKSRTVLLNQNSRGHTWEYIRNKKGKRVVSRRGQNNYYTLKKRKIDYSIYLHVLVHELVHYRWHYLDHGAEFEKRVGEILHGKVFPQKQLYPEATKAENNAIVSNNNIPTASATASASVPVVRQELITDYI